MPYDGDPNTYVDANGRVRPIDKQSRPRQQGDPDYRGIRPSDSKLTEAKEFEERRIQNIQRVVAQQQATEDRRQQQLQKGATILKKRLGAKLSAGASKAQLTRTVRSLGMVWWICVALYIVQICGWVIAIGGLALIAFAATVADIDLAKTAIGAAVLTGPLAPIIFGGAAVAKTGSALVGDIPGQIMFWIGHLIAAAAGVVTLLIGLGVFIPNRVKCLNTENKTFAFVFALVFYLAPIVNLFPWAIIWVYNVLRSSDKDESIFS